MFLRPINHTKVDIHQYTFELIREIWTFEATEGVGGRDAESSERATRLKHIRTVEKSQIPFNYPTISYLIRWKEGDAKGGCIWCNLSDRLTGDMAGKVTFVGARVSIVSNL